MYWYFGFKRTESLGWLVGGVATDTTARSKEAPQRDSSENLESSENPVRRLLEAPVEVEMEVRLNLSDTARAVRIRYGMCDWTDVKEERLKRRFPSGQVSCSVRYVLNRAVSDTNPVSRRLAVASV